MTRGKNVIPIRLRWESRPCPELSSCRISPGLDSRQRHSGMTNRTSAIHSPLSYPHVLSGYPDLVSASRHERLMPVLDSRQKRSGMTRGKNGIPTRFRWESRHCPRLSNSHYSLGRGRISPSSLHKSTHFGLCFSIRLIFHERFHFLSCFSRKIASLMSSNIS